MSERRPASTPVIVLVTVILTLLVLAVACCAGDPGIRAFIRGFRGLDY